jgi:hypothetical protein
VSTPASVDPAEVGSPDRRTVALLAALDAAGDRRQAALLTGPGVDDLLILPSRQVVRLRIALADYAARHGLGLVVLTPGAGVQALPTLPGGRAVAVEPAAAGAHPADVLAGLLEQVRAQSDPVLLVVDHADVLLPPSPSLDLALAAAGVRDTAADATFHTAGHRLVLIDRGGGVAPLVEHDLAVARIALGLPDETERVLYFQRAAAARKSPPLVLPPDLDPAEAGRLAGGLALVTAEQARRTSNRANPVTRRRIAEVKGAAVRAAARGTLEVVPVTRTLADVAGLPQVRLALADTAAEDATTVRWCLGGPPGTGKSLVAAVVAEVLGVTLVRYGQVFDMWLGNSERNVRRAHEVLVQMAPILLFVDEADTKGLGRRGGAGGHQAYDSALGDFLATFGDAGDSASGLSFLLATNRVHALDPAVLSRCSKTIPVLYPDAAEAAQIFALHARRAQLPLEVDPAALTALFDEHLRTVPAVSGRTIVARVHEAWGAARRAGSTVIAVPHVRRALADGFDSDWSAADEHATLAAIGAASTRRVLPWEAAVELGQVNARPPGYLAPYLAPDGQLRMDEVRARAAELAAVLGER